MEACHIAIYTPMGLVQSWDQPGQAPPSPGSPAAAQIRRCTNTNAFPGHPVTGHLILSNILVDYTVPGLPLERKQENTGEENLICKAKTVFPVDFNSSYNRK